MTGHWVHSWASAPQPTGPGETPPAPYTRDSLVFAGSTLRQTIRASVGGRRLRLGISNAFGGTVLSIAAVSAALPVGGQAGVSAIRPATARDVTFGGRTSVNVPVGTEMISDPLDFAIEARANLTVTVYLADGHAAGDITSHTGSRTTSFMVLGNHVRDADLPGAASVEHWYFLGGVEVWSELDTAAAVVLGDSLTDGRGSTTNNNDRWPDKLLDRLHAHRDTANVAIVNQAIGGNRVLGDGLGPSALGRVDRDVLARGGATWLVVFEGVNDIGVACDTEAAQKQVVDNLIGAYEQIIRRAQAVGIRVYGATITPFGGNIDYDDPAGLREVSRRAVNDWVRASRQFDAVIDFDKAARDPADPGRLLPAFDVGDHLHMNPAGYQALADAVPARLFRLSRHHVRPPGGGE